MTTSTGYEPPSAGVPSMAVAAPLADRGGAVLTSVQGLRALAATLVLLGHANSTAASFAADKGLPFARPLGIFPGGFGVDLFFLISGFIMVASSGRFFGSVNGARTFMSRRLVRILPLYYAATLLYLPIFLFGAKAPTEKLLPIVASFLFLPYPTYGVDGDNVFPVLSLGWTLNYEMFFYVVFAAFLPLKRPFAIAAVLLALSIAVTAGHAAAPPQPLRFWLQPIVLEFCLGMAVAAFWSHRRDLFVGSRPGLQGAGIALVTASVAFVLADPLGVASQGGFESTPNDLLRFTGWGLPAAVALLGALLVHWNDNSLGARLARHVGDCSYSLYLTHSFCLIVILKVSDAALRFGRGGAALPWALFGLAIASAYVVAHVVYVRFELPVTRALRRVAG